MLVIQGRNVNHLYYEAMWKAPIFGFKEGTRNGGALVFSTPVCSVYDLPQERMLYNADRDANPFFHIMESLWMLSGDNKHAFVTQYASNLANYSDDGVTLNGAYGHRWRNHFEYDQLEWLIAHLENDPSSRRAVLGMWDPMEDPKSVDQGSGDVPCNTHIYFRLNDGRLDMTVCCRSNDVVWGAYGANAVHMSILQEFVARSLGVPMGRYYQISNNLHVYDRHAHLIKPTEHSDPYLWGVTDGGPLVSVPLCNKFSWRFIKEVEEFVADPNSFKFDSEFLTKVAGPMREIWALHKSGYTKDAADLTYKIHDSAIALACKMWLTRRIK